MGTKDSTEEELELNPDSKSESPKIKGDDRATFFGALISIRVFNGRRR